MRSKAAGTWLVAAMMATGVGVGACSKKPAPTPVPAPAGAVSTWPTRIKVAVSIPPLQGLVEPLLPPQSAVVVLVQPGVSEHGFEPTAVQVKDAINADMLVWIGGMEPALDALSKGNPRAKRVDVRLADALGIEVHEEHDHGKEEHDHGGEGDPHVWLDPVTAKVIVQRLAEKVTAMRPGTNGVQHPDAKVAADALLARLDALDKEYRDGLADAKDRTIVVGHDAYGWLARRYGLKTVAISGLTASEPSPADLQKAKAAVRTHGLKAVLSEPQLSPAAAKSIADETGAKVLSLDPLGEGDYFLMMRQNLREIRRALGLEPLDEPKKDRAPEKSAP